MGTSTVTILLGCVGVIPSGSFASVCFVLFLQIQHTAIVTTMVVTATIEAAATTITMIGICNAEAPRVVLSWVEMLAETDSDSVMLAALKGGIHFVMAREVVVITV